jgi:hypothetical protein
MISAGLGLDFRKSLKTVKHISELGSGAAGRVIEAF